MKKVIILFACLVSLVLLLCACQAPSDKNDEHPTTDVSTTYKQETNEESEESTSVTETVSESVQNVTSNPETTKKPTVPAWKTAYLKFLESHKNEYDSYALIYIDNDDIPELYLSGFCEATGDCICSYKNGKVVEEHLNRIGGGRYIKRKGDVINQNGNMGCCYTSVYKLTQNGFELTFSASSIEHVKYLENGEYELTYEYSVEDEVVSEAAYDAAVNAAFNFAQSVPLDENAVGYDEIKKQIANCK